MSREMYEVEDVANIFRVTKWSVYRWSTEGRIKPIKFSERRRAYAREEIERFARDNGYRVDFPEVI